MNAVDELRCLLEDRSIDWEWRESDDSITWSDSEGTAARARNEISFKGLTGKVIVYGLTPEQAIAATLGAERTCRDAYPDSDYHFGCSECGYVGRTEDWFRYCPNCGRRVTYDRQGD